MKLIRSMPIILGAFLATLFVYALPSASHSHKLDIAEREDGELVPRNKLFAEHGSYDKHQAISFVKKIPDKALRMLGDKVATLHSVDGEGRVVRGGEMPNTGFRLDHQGKTSDDRHNLQVQINGPRTGKSTIGGILVKGDVSPKSIRKHLVHAVMHPSRDREGNEYLHEVSKKDGSAPTDSVTGKKLRNAEARKEVAKGKEKE